MSDSQEIKTPRRKRHWDPDLLREITALLGVIFFVAGIALVYRPAALIVLGIILFAFAFFTMGLRRGSGDSGK